MDVKSLAGRTAVVTGAASGIGRETALALAGRGASLAVCDVDTAGLGTLERELGAAGCQVLAQRVDVAVVEEMRAFADAVHERVEAVDLLVNNAGVAVAGGFLDTTLEDWDWITGVNLHGVVHGCHEFIPAMVKRGAGGHVVIVASAAGFMAAEALAAYCTTKFAVLGLAEALADELRRHQIGVTAICPGIIDTPITRNTRVRGIYDSEGARGRMVEVYQRRGYTAERVARNILKAVQRDRIVAPVSPEAWTMYYLKRFTPWLARRIQAMLAERNRRELAQQAGL